MTLANKLTVSRIGLTFVMTVFLTFPSIPWGKTLALLIFILASLTDYWDGKLARAGGSVTPFGRLMDPLADKILICAAFISFVAIQQIVPAWVVIAIVSREFLVTGLRLVAAGAGRILEAGRLGKHKMVWQIVVIVVVIAGLAVREDIIPRLPETDLRRNVTAYYSAGFNWLAYGLSSLTAVLTVISGVFYFWKNRELVIREM